MGTLFNMIRPSVPISTSLCEFERSLKITPRHPFWFYTSFIKWFFWCDHRFQFGRVCAEKIQKFNLPLKHSVSVQDLKNHIAFEIRWDFNIFWSPLGSKIQLSNLNTSESWGPIVKTNTFHQTAAKTESWEQIKKIN